MGDDVMTSTDAGPALLEVRGIRKSFGDTHAVRGIDFSLQRGEFVGLMGPNGAGKSTLIKILSGVYTADRGEITFDGRPVRSLAGRPEVGFVHQDLGLVDDLSVLDNLRLGAPVARLVGPILNPRTEARLAQAALDRVDLQIPVAALVGSLSPGQKALLAVARLLDLGAQIIVVDETTSTLPPRESRWFVETLHRAADNGTTVVMVSHKLSELLSGARRIILMIDGSIVADRPVTPEDRAEVVQLLGSHEEQKATEQSDQNDGPSQGLEVAMGEPLLELKQVAWGTLQSIDLVVRRGEVVGLTGLVGSGLHDIALLAMRALHPAHGSVWTASGARSALVAPQRETQGAIADLPVLWNATLSSLGRWRSPWRLLRLRRERADGDAVMTDLRVVPTDSSKPMGTLSGGNQQKVLFGRALLRQADIFVLCEPTRGVDVRTRVEIYSLIGRLKARGAAILVITSDSEDLFAVCDQIGVLQQGTLERLWDPTELSEDQLAEIL